MKWLNGYQLAPQAGAGLALALFLLALPACRPSNRGAEKLAQDTQTVEQIDTDFTFNNITLEQADPQGRKVWSVKAEQATYSQDKQRAEVRNPTGELFRDGRAIYRIQAQQGTVQQDGEKIFLKGAIMATDIKSGAVFRGEELEWQPKEGVLIVRKNLTGTHPQIKANAQEARLFDKERRLELSGNVVAVTTNPNLRLKTKALTWRIDEQKVISNAPVEAEKLVNGQPTDTARGDRAEVNLQTKIAILSNNAAVNLIDPTVQAVSDRLTWNLNQNTLQSDAPISLLDRQQQVTLTANRGRLDIQPRIATFQGNVQANSQRNQSQLFADTLIWNLKTKELQAQGNVNYRQTDPSLNVRGNQANGRLDNRTVVISGGRVATEIIPQ
jgi:LPS export ABC transporter protein LptC